MKLLGLIFAIALSSSLIAGEERGSFDKSVSVSGPVELDVKTDSGGITIRPGSSGIVKVHANLKAQHGWFVPGNVEDRIREIERHPPVEQSGNRVRIGYVLGRDALNGISMELEIETPADSQVRARADSGGVRVDGVRGPVDCKTDSGGVVVSDVSADVRAAADSGSVHIRNVKGSVTARADSGGIEALEIGGSVNAQTDSGGIRISQTSAAAITARADSGGVRIAVAPGAGYDVRAETDSGRISTPPMTVQSTLSNHRVEGTIRGGGPLLNIHVSSGSVTIE